jgi:hypothetical protein
MNVRRSAGYLRVTREAGEQEAASAGNETRGEHRMTSSDGARTEIVMDRHVLHEVGQVMRALEANGPSTEEELALLVGAPYWERNRFQRALSMMLGDGLLERESSGLIRTT